MEDEDRGWRIEMEDEDRGWDRGWGSRMEDENRKEIEEEDRGWMEIDDGHRGRLYPHPLSSILYRTSILILISILPLSLSSTSRELVSRVAKGIEISAARL